MTVCTNGHPPDRWVRGRRVPGPESSVVYLPRPFSETQAAIILLIPVMYACKTMSVPDADLLRIHICFSWMS